MTIKTNTQKQAQKPKAVYIMDEKRIMPFDKAFGKLKIDDGEVVRSVICNMCKITGPYFSMKKSGKRGITYYEQRVIRSTFQCFGIDAFTGETILIN